MRRSVLLSVIAYGAASRADRARRLFSSRSHWCGTSPLQYRYEVSLALRASAMTVEVRALLDRERHVIQEDCRATDCAQTTPKTVPRTTTCWPATIPVTLPFSPTSTSAA